MDYRFSLTPRLMLLAGLCLLTLLVLFFLMGIQLGRQWAPAQAATKETAARPAMPPAPASAPARSDRPEGRP